MVQKTLVLTRCFVYFYIQATISINNLGNKNIYNIEASPYQINGSSVDEKHSSWLNIGKIGRVVNFELPEL